MEIVTCQTLSQMPQGSLLICSAPPKLLLHYSLCLALTLIKGTTLSQLGSWRDSWFFELRVFSTKWLKGGCDWVAEVQTCVSSQGADRRVSLLLWFVPKAFVTVGEGEEKPECRQDLTSFEGTKQHMVLTVHWGRMAAFCHNPCPTQIKLSPCHRQRGETPAMANSMDCLYDLSCTQQWFSFACMSVLMQNEKLLKTTRE